MPRRERPSFREEVPQNGVTIMMALERVGASPGPATCVVDWDLGRSSRRHLYGPKDVGSKERRRQRPDRCGAGTARAVALAAVDGMAG